MLFTKKIIKISPCLSKLQLAKVGEFFKTQCSFDFLRKAVVTSTIRLYDTTTIRGYDEATTKN